MTLIRSPKDSFRAGLLVRRYLECKSGSLGHNPNFHAELAKLQNWLNVEEELILLANN